ncbi:MAG TPA: ABC transporter substrate-binding protein [Thermomicrobiales bacterium]|nr:ABC transporter substrate-binding protein [Thermomicrobiales bacterium]
MVDRQSGPFQVLFDGLKRGDISRRQFIQRATALGMGASVALFCAESATFAQDASPAAGATPSPGTATRPEDGTEGQTRGAGGELRIIQWQAPSHLSSHVATGDKDSMASSPVSEPLMNRLPDGSLVPCLVTEVPTVANGLLAPDLTSVTYHLLEGVTWSDGKPFTANDVKFTWQWVMTPENGAVYTQIFETIKDIEVVDDLTAKVTFKAPNPTWSDAHTGSGSGVIYPQHILEGGGEDANNAFRLKPIGTGPYVVESFSPNDQVVFAVNENYREPNKPFFSKVNVKGGGDSTSAARAVLQTGEYDYAWNLALEPEILRNMESDSSAGTLIVVPGGGIERININFSDPDKEVDGQRSQKDTPHPLFSDPAVRHAMNIAIDRETIANQLFFGGDEEPAVVNILSGIPSMDSPNTKLVFDTDQANKILDDAGWVKDGDVRKKDGLELKIRYQTTVNNLRQKIQAIVKKNLEAIGFKVELQQTDSAIFFDSAVGNDQSNTHFYTDLNMFQSTVGSPPPVSYMVRWYAGPNGENIAQKSNDWNGRNFQRYNNPEYDKLYEAAQTEADMEKSAQLFIQMNDILYNDNAVMPLVMVGKKSGASKKLRESNLSISPYEFDYWNIANWNFN